jgi:hypothetical protein
MSHSTLLPPRKPKPARIGALSVSSTSSSQCRLIPSTAFSLTAFDVFYVRLYCPLGGSAPNRRAASPPALRATFLYINSATASPPCTSLLCIAPLLLLLSYPRLLWSCHVASAHARIACVLGPRHTCRLRRYQPRLPVLLLHRARAAPSRTRYSTRAPGPLLAPLLVPGYLLPPGSFTCRARACPHAAACLRSRAARQRSAACTWPSRTLACAHTPDPHRLLPAHSRAACAPSRAVPVRATRCPRASIWPGAAVLARRPSTSTPSRVLPPTRTDAAPPAAARPHSPELAAPCLDPPSRAIAAWARLQLLCRQAPTTSATRRATSLASAPRAREPPAAQAVACPPAALLPRPALRSPPRARSAPSVRRSCALPTPAPRAAPHACAAQGCCCLYRVEEEKGRERKEERREGDGGRVKETGRAPDKGE